MENTFEADHLVEADATSCPSGQAQMPTLTVKSTTCALKSELRALLSSSSVGHRHQLKCSHAQRSRAYHETDIIAPFHCRTVWCALLAVGSLVNWRSIRPCRTCIACDASKRRCCQPNCSLAASKDEVCRCQRGEDPASPQEELLKCRLTIAYIASTIALALHVRESTARASAPES